MSLRERVLSRVRRWTRRALDRLEPPPEADASGPDPGVPARSPVSAVATSPIVVAPEITPNPNARKFVLSPSPEWSRARSFSDAAAGSEDPLGRALLAVAGVASVFAVEDFVTVVKDPSADWQTLEPDVCAALRATLQA